MKSIKLLLLSAISLFATDHKMLDIEAELDSLISKIEISSDTSYSFNCQVEESLLILGKIGNEKESIYELSREGKLDSTAIEIYQDHIFSLSMYEHYLKFIAFEGMREDMCVDAFRFYENELRKSDAKSLIHCYELLKTMCAESQ